MDFYFVIVKNCAIELIMFTIKYETVLTENPSKVKYDNAYSAKRFAKLLPICEKAAKRSLPDVHI